MNKNIVNKFVLFFCLIIIIVFSLLAMCFFCYTLKEFVNGKSFSEFGRKLYVDRDVCIDMSDNSKISIEDTWLANEDKKIYDDELYYILGDNYSKLGINNLRVIVDGNETSSYYDNDQFVSYTGKSSSSFIKSSASCSKIDVLYDVDLNEYVKEYKNYDVLELCINKGLELSNFNIVLKFPKEIDTLKISDDNYNIEKIDGYTYKISNIKKLNAFQNRQKLKLIFDKGTLNTSNVINKNYRYEKINKLGIKNGICFIIVICTIVSFVLYKYKKGNQPNKKDIICNRDVDNMISPVLAEAFVDDKIDMKNSIMACIVDLIQKGNLKNFDNDMVEIVSLQGLKPYEIAILKLLDLDNKKVFSFKDVATIIKKDISKTKSIYWKFKEIKNMIIVELFDQGLYHKNWRKQNKKSNLVKDYVISILLFVIMSLSIAMNLPIWANMIGGLLVLGIKLSIRKALVPKFRKDDDEMQDKFNKIVFWGFFAELIFVSVIINHADILVMSISTIAMIINIFIEEKCSDYKYTQSGIEEFKKVYGLKLFLKNYSNLDDRDMDGVIVWDKYLAYAVAFDLSNKITKKFKESKLLTNVFIEDIMEMEDIRLY